MKILYSLLYFSFLAQALACEIKTYDQIYKINNLIDDTIFKKSNCSPEQEQAFLNLVSSASGIISSDHLTNVIKREYKKEIDITPKTINVLKLSEVIEERLQKNDVILENLKSLHSASSLNLDKGQNFSVSCSQCETSGRKNIKLELGQKVIWLSADLLSKVQALKVIKNISYHTPLITNSDFELVEVIGKRSHKYFTDIKNIQFYRVNRNLKEGALLEVHDIRPKKLITFGQKINIHLKNDTINLKTTGIAQKSGTFGEYIRIKNPKTNKIMTGKIVNFNTVVVEI